MCVDEVTSSGADISNCESKISQVKALYELQYPVIFATRNFYSGENLVRGVTTVAQMRIALHNNIHLNMTNKYACFYITDSKYTLQIVKVTI